MRYCWFNTEEEFSFSWGSAQFFSGSSCSPNFITLSVTQLILQFQAFPKGSRLGLTPGKFPLKSVLYFFCIVGEFTPRDRQTNFCFLDSDHSHMTNCLLKWKKNILCYLAPKNLDFPPSTPSGYVSHHSSQGKSSPGFFLYNATSLWWTCWTFPPLCGVSGSAYY